MLCSFPSGSLRGLVEEAMSTVLFSNFGTRNSLILYRAAAPGFVIDL